MLARNDLIPWVVEALKELGGTGKIDKICEYVWRNHEQELQGSGSLLFKWQYEIRWAAKTLRERKVLKSAAVSKRGYWELR